MDIAARHGGVVTPMRYFDGGAGRKISLKYDLIFELPPHRAFRRRGREAEQIANLPATSVRYMPPTLQASMAQRAFSLWP
jgi:hypothetical protein